MKKRFIKNYTTEKSVSDTVSEIQKLLSENGATGIYFDYGDAGLLKGIVFNLAYNGKTLSFKLPAKVDAAYNALFKGMAGEYTYGAARREKAAKIAWRVCLLWVEAQLTHVNLEQAELTEVFLPYLMMSKDKTLFEGMKENQFQLGSGQ